MTETYAQSRWTLADLYPAQDIPEMSAAFADMEAGVAAFEARRLELVPHIPEGRFLDLVRQLETISRIAYRIYNFAALSFSADTPDQSAQAFLAQVQQQMALMENRTLFFSLWWKDLDGENASRLMAASGDYRYYLEEMRHFKPHTLSEPEDQSKMLTEPSLGSG